MKDSYSESYKAAGVDVTAGYRAVDLIKKHIERTKIPGVIGDIGGFGGLFALPETKNREPILVSGTDGVGTKLKIAYYMDKNDTVGIDCVAMCVNDIICAGAKPLFFLDYIACGKNYPKKIEQIAAGIAEGCLTAGCALIGGETAEHPGMMADDEYDLAGFAVGIVDKSKIPDKNKVKNGDIVVGIASSGVHSNGFSLIRKVFSLTKKNHVLFDYYSELGKTLGEELLTPTKIYVNPILELFEKDLILTAANITGGGFYENIPRCFNGGRETEIGAFIKKSAVKTPPIFNIIAAKGKIPEKDMYNTYNMGMGMCVVCSRDNADKVIHFLNSAGENAAIIGEIKSGISGVIIE